MRVLVVEDEHLIASSIKKGLEQERFAVDVAYDGTTGFDLAASENYDVIILDLLLPGMDGLTFCRQLRLQKIHTPILVLTAKTQVSDKVSTLDSGADDYLTKPFSFEELLARVRALGRRPQQAISPVLTVSTLVLDSANFEVRRDGKALALSSKEFSLMEFLMRNAGKTVSKEQIIDHVWNYDANILPNTVEVNIRNLRNKLGKPNIIRTIRGFGYKLETNV